MRRVRIAVALCLSTFSAPCLVQGQENGQQGAGAVFLANQEVRVANLPTLTAPSPRRSAVLLVALETILHDKKVCCGKDSALADEAEYASLSDSLSLRDFSARLQGKYQLSDGQPVILHAEFVAREAITGDFIVRTLLDQRALIMDWRSHLYVLYGALFNENRFYSGLREFQVLKLYLLDLRFSDSQRQITFDRQTDDWEQVRGMLGVTFTVSPSPWK